MSTRTLLRGGHVHTPAHPSATALLVDGDRVGWVGDDAGAAGIADDCDRVVELEGRLVTPAFVDAHAHLSQTGLASMSADLSTAATMTEALDLVAAAAREARTPVVLGHGWDETRWPERRPFTRSELDRATDGRPAYVTRVDMHSAVVSSALLDRAPAVPVTEGYDESGRVERDAHHETRLALFTLIPPAMRAGAIRIALQSAAAAGIGMLHELGAAHICPTSDFGTLFELHEEATFPTTVCYWGDLDLEVARELGCSGAAGYLCMDGAIGSRTAALHEPYRDDPSTAGHLYLTADQVADHVVGCTAAGLQAGFHVIGDRAVFELVDGFRLAAERVGVAALVGARHRLEHLEMIDAEQVATLAAYGVTASVQPMFDGLWGGDSSLYDTRLGEERARPMNPFASMRRAGVPLAFGSDSPVTPFDPWGAVRAAAHHHNEAERVSVAAAVEAHTVGGWRAAHRDEGGTLEVGAPAHLAVWDGSVDGPDLDRYVQQDPPACLLNLVDGRVAFEQEGALA